MGLKQGWKHRFHAGPGKWSQSHHSGIETIKGAIDSVAGYLSRNRTIVGLKRSWEGGYWRGRDGRNRTIVGLKKFVGVRGSTLGGPGVALAASG